MKLIDEYRMTDGDEDLVELPESSASDLHQPISCELVNDKAGLESVIREWGELAEKCGFESTTPNLPASANHQFSDPGSELYILIFKSLHRVVGIAPFVLEKTPLFFTTPFNRLQLAGGVELNGIHRCDTVRIDLAVEPGFESKVSELMILYLEKAGQWLHQIDFTGISEQGFLMQRILPEIKKRGWSFKIRPDLHEPDLWNLSMPDPEDRKSAIYVWHRFRVRMNRSGRGKENVVHGGNPAQTVRESNLITGEQG